MDEQPFKAPEAPINKGVLLFHPLAVASYLIFAVVFFCVGRSMVDPDIWWHLRDAQIQLSSHSFITHDLFSFTAAGSAWMDHEWLAELPFYAGFHVLGETGLYVVTLATVETIFLLLFYLTYLYSKSITSATFATVIGVVLSTVSFGPRTLLYGWMFLIVELIVLVQAQKRERAIWILPLVFAVWVNTHGSWLIGIIVFAFYVASNSFDVSSGSIENRAASAQHIKRMVLCWCVSLGTLFLNPYGWRLVFYPFNLAFRQKLNVANVAEWSSLDFHSPRGRIILAFLALLFLCQLVRSRKWSLFELAIMSLGFYSACTYSRFLFLAAILVGPVLAKSLASRSPTPSRALSPLTAGAIVFFICCVIFSRVHTPDKVDMEGSLHFPVKALPFLSTFHPEGRVFHDYNWGGFLIWNVRQIPDFVDSRVDIFEYNGTFKDYLDIIHLEGSLDLLNKYKIRYVLFESDSPLVYLLKATHEWKVDYEDKSTILLERSTPLVAAK